MRSLIGSLLELARSGAEPEREPFQLDELVEDTLERARSRFPSVTWEAPVVEPTVVDGDRDRMERAVWNLLENAGKWSGEGARSRSRSRAASYPSATTGRGSTRRTRRSSSSASTARRRRASMPGAGLGLSIVREVAEAHGGTVVAENAEGGGARFRLSLNGAARRGSSERLSQLLGFFHAGVVRLHVHRTPPGPLRLCGPRPARSGAFPDPLR